MRYILRDSNLVLCVCVCGNFYFTDEGEELVLRNLTSAANNRLRFRIPLVNSTQKEIDIIASNQTNTSNRWFSRPSYNAYQPIFSTGTDPITNFTHYGKSFEICNFIFIAMKDVLYLYHTKIKDCSIEFRIPLSSSLVNCYTRDTRIDIVFFFSVQYFLGNP